MLTTVQPKRLTEHFGLNPDSEYEFVDINAYQDIPLFLDPYGISIMGTKLAKECEDQITTFFQFLVDSIRINNQKSVEQVLNALHEVNEIGLGYSKGKSRGRGIGKVQAQDILAAFRNSAAMQSGDIRDIADCALLIPGINRDKISDITANIIKKQLVVFTQQQCLKWEIPTQRVAVNNAFDHAKLSFTSYYAQLPVIEWDAKILLPVTAVRRTPELSKDRFYRNFVLEYLKAEHQHAGDSLATLLKNGRVVVRISDLKQRYPLKENFLHEFTKEHPEVLERFKSELRRSALKKTTPVLATQARILSAAERKDILMQIPHGTQHAGSFHKLATDNLTHIFADRLSNTRVEVPKNEGRKRIDVTFDNSGKEGFFEQLNSKHHIFCPKIIIECKNYGAEIGNPELDQLMGRLNKRTGKFGMLVCRQVKDPKLLLKRCKDALTDKEDYILVLDDQDVTQLLQYREEGKEKEIDQYLSGLMDKLIF